MVWAIPAARRIVSMKLASVASFEDGFRWDDQPYWPRWVPPVPAGIIKGFAGFVERSVPPLPAHIKILRTDTQRHGTFVLKRPILDAPDRDYGADLDIGAEPVLDRLLGLIFAGGIGFPHLHAARWIGRVARLGRTLDRRLFFLRFL